MRCEVICIVCNAKFSFYQLSIIIHGRISVCNFGLRTEVQPFFLFCDSIVVVP